MTFMIQIENIKIKFPKWWKTALAIAIIIIALKIEPNNASKVIERVFTYFSSG